MPANKPVILLKETHGSRYLPIWAGPVEAVSVVHAQQGADQDGVPPDDQYALPHALLVKVLDGAGVQVLGGTIVSLTAGVFTAWLMLSNGATVSGTPGDVIALALRAGAPVFANAEILDEAGVILPDEPDGAAATIPAPGHAATLRPPAADMRRAEVVGVRIEKQTEKPLALLKERQGDRHLMVWVSVVEAVAIATAGGAQAPEGATRTHEMFCDVLSAVGVQLLAANITEARDGVFACNLALSGNMRVRARPGDSIALALRADAAILVAAEVLDQAGVRMPPDE